MSELPIHDSDVNDRQPETIPENPVRPLPGRHLAARREELGMTIEQVANQLNLAPRQIQAIEADDYAALPGIASIRGFIRAYAKLLKIDAAPLLTAIASETTPLDENVSLRRALPSRPFTDNRLFSNERNAFFSRRAVAGIILVLAAALAFVGIDMMGWVSILPASTRVAMDQELAKLTGNNVNSAADAREGSKAPEEAMAGTASPSFAMPAAQANSGKPAALRPDQKASASGHDGTLATANTHQMSSSNSTESNGAGNDLAHAAGKRSGFVESSSKKNLLLLKLREDSWIDIRRPDDRILISRLVKAGATESFEIEGPVGVVIGNAAGVEASLRGEPLNLKAKAKNNVARFNLK